MQLRDLALRFFGYLLLGAAIFQGVVVAAEAGYAAAMGMDDGPIEFAQLALCLAAAAVLFAAGGRHPEHAVLLRIWGVLGIFAAGRELDYLSERLIAEHAYMVITGPALASAGYLLATRWQEVSRSVPELAGRSGVALLFAGFFIVVIYSQLIGQKELWQAVMGEGWQRPVKDMVEETSELLGYVLILLGSIELYVGAGSSNGESS